MRSLRNITVLFVSGRIGLGLSRVERYWLPVMRALLAEQATVMLVAAPRAPLIEPARALGVTIAKTRVDRLNLWVTRNRLRAYLKRYAPAVAFATGYGADVPLRLAARGLPVKVVSSWRCGGWPVRGVGPLGTWVRQHVERATRSRVDAFAVDAAALRDVMVADGVPAERVCVLRPAVDVAVVAQEAAVPVELPEGSPRVGYAGALEPSRGLGTLAAAAPRIRERHPGALVLIAGEGLGRLGLVAAALEGRVRLLGRVASVPAVLAALDVCVFPASEAGIPASLLEAAALGRPIVATDVDGITEVVADGREALLVPRGDPPALAEAVSTLLDDPARAAALGAAARARVIDEHSMAAAERDAVAFVRSLLA